MGQADERGGGAASRWQLCTGAHATSWWVSGKEGTGCEPAQNGRSKHARSPEGLFLSLCNQSASLLVAVFAGAGGAWRAVLQIGRRSERAQGQAQAKAGRPEGGVACGGEVCCLLRGRVKRAAYTHVDTCAPPSCTRPAMQSSALACCAPPDGSHFRPTHQPLMPDPAHPPTTRLVCTGHHRHAHARAGRGAALRA